MGAVSHGTLRKDRINHLSSFNFICFGYVIDSIFVNDEIIAGFHGNRHKLKKSSRPKRWLPLYRRPILKA
jgi:hypothetical protein